MRQAFEAVWSAATLALAVALVAFLLWFALRAHAHMWRLAAARYRGSPPSASIARKLEVMVIAERGVSMPKPFRNAAYRNYPGLLLAIHEDGLALSLVPPFNILCPPLFLPFDEMELEPTDWALWSEPFAIRMRRLPDIDLIIGRDTAGWVRDHVEQPSFGLGR